MIKVSIYYPNNEGSKFDMDYYLHKHMPMSIEKQGSGLKEVSIDIGVNSGPPESKPPYVVVCNLLYETTEAFYSAVMPHAEVLMNDIKNYTDIETIVQISEVKNLPLDKR
jgi:uncharacterized protein (TIGR02118 family)